MLIVINIEGHIRKLVSSAPLRAKNYTERDGKVLPVRWLFFRLRKYIDAFLRGSRENRLILMPGLRGAGKTTLLWQLYKYLVERWGIDPRRILVLSVDDLILLDSDIFSAIEVYERVLNEPLEALKKEVFIFVDEASFDPKWSLAVKAAIYDRSDRVFTLVTGSSALSMRVTTDLARRAVIEKLFPLNYSEYLMLRFNVRPSRGFTSRIRDAIFKSASAKEACTRLRKLKSEILSLQLKLGDVRLDTHLEYFLKVGGLPFSAMEGEHALNKVYEVVERIVYHDLPKLHGFDHATCESALKFLALLATRHPERLSLQNISQNIGLTRQVLSRVVSALIDAEVLFQVLHYGKGISVARKARKYYFTTPILRAGILFNLGYSLSEEEVLGSLLEDAVASSLYRLVHINYLRGIHYPSKGADLLAITGNFEERRVIPIEVSWGPKDKSQVEETIRQHGALYGIVVDSSQEPRAEEHTLWVPRHWFLLI